MFRTLERRLTGFYLLVLVVVLAAYGIGAFVLFRFAMFRGLDQVNARMLAPVVSAFEREDEGYAEVTHELSEVAISDREHLALLTRSGKVLYARGLQLDPEPELHSGAFTQSGPDAMRLLVLPLVRDHETIGYLRVGQSLEGPTRTLRTLALGLAFAAPLALALAWLAGSWLASKAIQPVQEAFERERRFTRDASHELRTPLSVVLAHAQLALAEPQLPVTLRDKLLVIERTARKMTTLVGDLLTLGRGDVGIHGEAVAFSLEELVEEELEAMQPLAAERGCELHFEPSEGSSTVRGEPSRIAQAIRNLLDNALRYSPPSSRIDVAIQGRPGRLEVSVANPGPGIPADQQPHLFDRFMRLEEGRSLNPEGSGLGLPISRAVARAHGGDLTLTSVPGRTVFTLCLPTT